jgi:hypothetical protein
MDERRDAKGKVLRSQFGTVAREIFFKIANESDFVGAARAQNTRLELERRALSSVRVGDGTKASSRRLVDAGAAGVSALLTAQPFAEFGDPEPFAQVTGQARREQQAAMLAATADRNERGFAADQVGQGLARLVLPRVAVARPHLVRRLHGSRHFMGPLHVSDAHGELDAALSDGHGLSLQQAKGVGIALLGSHARHFVEGVVEPVPFPRQFIFPRPQFGEPFHGCSSRVVMFLFCSIPYAREIV